MIDEIVFPSPPKTVLDFRNDDFLACLSYFVHEARNPVYVLENSLNALRTGRLSPGEQNAVHVQMERQIEHIKRLIVDMSAFSSGNLELKKDHLKLAEVLMAALDLSTYRFEAKKQSLDLVLPDGEIWVQGDAIRLTQVFANLLSNASKYTLAEGKTRVEARQDSQMVEVAVRDNGVGIRREQLPRIFELFYRAGLQTEDDESRGMGLGITKRLVELHGGSVEAASDGAHKGSTFTVRLPLA